MVAELLWIEFDLLLLGANHLWENLHGSCWCLVAELARYGLGRFVVVAESVWAVLNEKTGVYVRLGCCSIATTTVVTEVGCPKLASDDEDGCGYNCVDS